MTAQNEFDIWLFDLLKINDLDLIISTKFKFLPYSEYNSTNKKDEFVIYEDWWKYKPDIIKSKVNSILKLNKRIYGRNCTLKKIDKPTSNSFLEKHHFFSYTKSKIKLGLFFEDELYAVATFASQRQFDNGRSAELLRYCSKSKYTIIGGLDKLLNAYVIKYLPDNIMTYIDPEWGSGESFINIGFERTETKLPMKFFVNKCTGKRIPEKHFHAFGKLNEYIEILNKGTYKLVKKITK